MAAPELTAIVLMGVSGSGKTTIGQALAQRLGWRFVDADDLHPAANIARMRAGHPLTDADRAPWLATVRASINQARSNLQGAAHSGAALQGAAGPIVLACSALKRSYREQISDNAPDVRIVWLHGSPELLRRRLLARQGHFMTADMLASQVATLEPPDPEEHIATVDVDASPEQIVSRILETLAAPYAEADAIAGAPAGARRAQRGQSQETQVIQDPLANQAQHANQPQHIGPGNSARRRAPPQRLRWVVSDVDGTIVNRNKDVTAPTVTAAQRLRQHGVGLTIASSRPPWGMRHVADALAITGPIAGFNGAVIVDQAGAVLHETRIPREATQAALAMLADEGVSAWLFTSSHWFILDPDGPHVAHERRTIRSDPAVLPDFSPWLDQACKIVGASDDLEHLAAVAARMAARLGDQANAGLSQKYYLDVTPPGVSKGSVVSYVAEANAIAASSIAAIGDMDNDIAMFRVAGYAIGMGNGSPAVLETADVITLSNEDDGFAAAINALLDGGAPRA